MESQKSFHNIKAVISYCGTPYYGWQKTPTGPSIEGTLQHALEKLTSHPIQLQAASRTDRGVHAEGQVVNFFVERRVLERFTCQGLEKALRGVLPRDISVVCLEEVEGSFHPTLDACFKEYQYSICNTEVQLPFHQNFSWHFRYGLNLDSMREAAPMLTGEGDFSAFSNSAVSPEKAQCRVFQILIDAQGGRLSIAITGKRFLYCMVRNLVGMLVYVGCGKVPLNALRSIIEGRDRKRGAVTAPAHGLVLKKVGYIHK
jgi:tRNA pseudouridine38-40 synthase